MTVIRVIINHVYINRCFSFKVGWPNCNDTSRFIFSPHFPADPFFQSGPTVCYYKVNPMSTAITVTGEYLQWSSPVEKTTVVSARVQSPVCLQAKMKRGKRGNQEQYLFFHMMTVQLKESNTAIIRKQRIFCVWAEMALSSHGY